MMAGLKYLYSLHRELNANVIADVEGLFLHLIPGDKGMHLNSGIPGKREKQDVQNT